MSGEVQEWTHNLLTNLSNPQQERHKYNTSTAAVPTHSFTHSGLFIMAPSQVRLPGIPIDKDLVPQDCRRFTIQMRQYSTPVTHTNRSHLVEPSAQKVPRKEKKGKSSSTERMRRWRAKPENRLKESKRRRKKGFSTADLETIKNPFAPPTREITPQEAEISKGKYLITRFRKIHIEEVYVHSFHRKFEPMTGIAPQELASMEVGVIGKKRELAIIKGQNVNTDS